MKKITVGAIGYRRHAGRILALIEESGLADVRLVYHPSRDIPDRPATRNLSDLRTCDAVFILSPNATHGEYLDYFSRDYAGWIFCEKPPVTSLTELRGLRANPERTFFNFNLRHSALAETVRRHRDSGALGRILSAGAVVTHGLAFTPAYRGSWRSDAARNPLGVTENVGIHWLDLFSVLFGAPTHLEHQAANHAGTGTATDTALLTATHDDGMSSSVLTSYAAPCRFTVQVIGTNGYLDYDGSTLSVRSPRTTCDAAGRSLRPPAIEEQALTTDELLDDSLRCSVRVFLEHVRDGAPLPPAWYHTALRSNELILNLAAR